MDRFFIELNTQERVEEYLRIMGKYEGDVKILAGDYEVDGKSVLGIFSLDLSHPVEIFLYAADEEIKKRLEKFRV